MLSQCHIVNKPLGNYRLLVGIKSTMNIVSSLQIIGRPILF